MLRLPLRRASAWTGLVSVACATGLLAGCSSEPQEQPPPQAGRSDSSTPSANAPPSASQPAATGAKSEGKSPGKGKVVATKSGLKYEILVEGSGPAAKTGQTVSVHYTGRLTDGTEFDSSLKRHQPYDVVLGESQVIKGWHVGITGMKKGEKRRLTIPPDLGYAQRGFPPVIPPNATLIFDIELLDIK
jgi:FKBP-type peptidyl-prolyl cis-trans isomerase